MKKNIIINTTFIRLDSLLKLAGAVETGGQAKQIIISEKVQVNGEICTMRGKKIYSKDKVVFGETEYEVQCNENPES